MSEKNTLAGVKVGDTLIVVRKGHTRGSDPVVFTRTVKKVGRKYVTTELCRYHIDGGLEATPYSASERAFLNEASKLAWESRQNLLDRAHVAVRSLYDLRRYTNAQLQQLIDIIYNPALIPDQTKE